MGAALTDNFQPSWKRASAGVGFGGALAENEGTSLNYTTFGHLDQTQTIKRVMTRVVHAIFNS